MAITGFYQNPKTIIAPTDPMWVGIQDGTQLEDMGKISYENFVRPIRQFVLDLANGLLWQDQVIDMLTEPPLSPQDGDRYLVVAPATGDWVGQQNEIATWNGATSSWTFKAPKDAWAVFVYNKDQLWAYRLNDWIMLGDLGRITDILHETEQARDDVLLNAEFIAVVDDLTGANTIGIVAGNIDDVIDVGQNISDVKKVATINTDVTKVAIIDTDVTKVALIDSEVSDVANIKQDVIDVAGIKTEVEDVAFIKDNVVAVDTNKININKVAAIDADVSKVGAIDTEVVAVANNETNINKVADNETNINKVSAIDADVTTVAGISTKVVDLADRKVKIDALYTDLPTIAQKANKDYVDQELASTRGASWDNTSIMDILSQYAVANGLATLDGSGKVYLTQIPSIPMMDVHVVVSQVEMLALTAVKGDIAIRTDLPSVFILSSDDPTEFTDWIELADLQGAVDSAIIAVKGVGWNGETIKENADNFKAHELAEAPHKIKNLKTGKTYQFGFQISNEGHPQMIYKEI